MLRSSVPVASFDHVTDLATEPDRLLSVHALENKGFPAIAADTFGCSSWPSFHFRPARPTSGGRNPRFWPFGQNPTGLAGITPPNSTRSSPRRRQSVRMAKIYTKPCLFDTLLLRSWPFYRIDTFGFPRSQWPFLEKWPPRPTSGGETPQFWPNGQNCSVLCTGPPLLARSSARGTNLPELPDLHKKPAYSAGLLLRSGSSTRFAPLPSLASRPRR